MLVGSSLLGLVLLASGIASVRAALKGGGPFRSGPWPGLTPAGARLVLALAGGLGGTQLVLGAPEVDIAARAAFPWLPLAALGSLFILALAGRILPEPGVLSAVAGAYLLPRTLVSYLVPEVAPPLALWPAAFALDVCLWLRREHVAGAGAFLPGLRPVARRLAFSPTPAQPFRPSQRRARWAGLLAGLVLAAVELPYDLILGAPPASWIGVPGLAALTLTPAAGLLATWLAWRVPVESLNHS
ncbi:MAG: hypothetical protein HYX52_04820 [Chloroflexi bacterium]|nr:hypothetical protein [Chloroflexota bacterium]